MDSKRRVAATVGVLFIAATVTNVVGTSLSRSLLDGADYLSQVAAHTNRVSSGALLELVAAGAVAGIAIALYPVLKNHGTGLALGSVVFRTIEAVMYGIAVVGLLSVVTLGRQFSGAALVDRAPLQAAADALLAVRDQAALVGVGAFGVGALMYYVLFYRSRLIPRWLSVWGILAVVVSLATWVVAVFSHRAITTYFAFMLPLALQEIVLAVWLILKGFASPERADRIAPASPTNGAADPS